uniref:Uncharacterized protein n=1 Tax=Glossina palpalis gambiensis TaxID=67801 RepID=A0A1B0AYU5_9MUSC
MNDKTVWLVCYCVLVCGYINLLLAFYEQPLIGTFNPFHATAATSDMSCHTRRLEAGKRICSLTNFLKA